METETDLDFGTLHLDAHRTQQVRIRHLGRDSYEAYYDGKWRKVIVTVPRLYIKVRDVKLTIEIFAL